MVLTHFRKKLKEISANNKIKIEIKGLLAIPSFSVKNDDNNIYKTYITQEMLKNGFIVNNSVYICINHNKKIFDKFFSILDNIFKNMNKFGSEKTLKKLLDSTASSSSFGRLNLK